jgi:hypothetical protein
MGLYRFERTILKYVKEKSAVIAINLIEIKWILIILKL